MFVFLLTEALSFLEVAAAPATEFLVELFYFLFLFSIRFESRKKFLTARMFLFIASWLANIGGRGEFGASESIREKLLFRCWETYHTLFECYFWYWSFPTFLFEFS